MRTFTEPEYQKFLADRQSQKADVVPMKHKPENLSSNAKFGLAPVDGREVTYAIQGDDTAGYTMYLDKNGNGDLADDPPLTFDKHNDKYSIVIKTTGKAVENGHEFSYPVVYKYQIVQISQPGQQQKMLGFLAYRTMLRRGTVRIGDHEVAFGLLGTLGIYNQDDDVILFDLNNDGELDTDTPKSSESFKISEKFVNIGNTTYEFDVDRYGRKISLRPLPEMRASRPNLTPGNKAPDIDFVDVQGKSHKLSDYRGKVVLIDFWGVWCFPCVAETPSLVDAYNKYHDKGFEIIGIDAADKEETLTKFATDKKVTWGQTREERDGRLHQLFRIDNWPSHFLIDADGSIVMFSNNWAKTKLDSMN